MKLTLLLLALSMPVFGQNVTEIKDWVASGSGCFGRLENPTNVTAKVVRESAEKIRIDFVPSEFSLNGDKPIRKDHPTFARECAFRVALYPQDNYRVVGMRVDAQGQLTKDEKVKVDILARLIAGGTGVDEKQITFDSNKVERNLSVPLGLTTPAGMTGIPEVACGQPRILGVDYSFINYRDDFKPKVDLTLKPAQVFMSIQLAKCEPERINAVPTTKLPKK